MDAQMAGIDACIRAHEAELMPYLPIFGWAHDGFSPALNKVKLLDMDAIEKRIQEARKADKSLLLAELRKAESLGAERLLAKPPCPAALRKLRRDFPHFSEVLDLVDRSISLAQLAPGQIFSLPPILLAGDPGVGKTAFSEALAEVLVQPMRRVDIASASAGFALSGAHETWSSAKQGVVWELLQSTSASGILLLEEIDKASKGNYPSLGPLYSLLESVSARHFMDEYIQIPVDASHLMIVATCNDDTLLDAALQSRFRRFQIPLPTEYEMSAIAMSVFRALRKNKPWGPIFDAELPASVIEEVSCFTPRQLSRVLEDAVGRAASCGRDYLLAADIRFVKSAFDGREKKPAFGFAA